MPTGYTAEVADGKVTDFRTFALRCARQFGATIMQRDEAADVPPARREVGDYYLTAVEEAKARADAVGRMTLADAERESRLAFERATADHMRYAESRRETRNRYNAMLVEVVAWQPPTPEHQGMKDFMVQQLTESRRFDCDFVGKLPTLMPAAEWLAREIETATTRLDRASESLAEERERCAKSNAWIDALYASLPPAPSHPLGA